MYIKNIKLLSTRISAKIKNTTDLLRTSSKSNSKSAFKKTVENDCYIR